KEQLKVRHYFRYADDIVILSGSKNELHQLRIAIQGFLSANLKLTLKSNYQVFPTDARGIDFLGYVFRHTHVRLRKKVKQNAARKLKRGASRQCIASYYGWMKHCNSGNLQRKLLKAKS